MSTIKPIIELDFDQIKADIVEFMKTNETFTDYNFEGSALNAIADMLAYNTHNIAYYANMVHNEGFLDTAQKRASVVSRAKELGYTPRSAICSTAFLDITVSGIAQNAAAPQIARGDTFSTSNDIASYKFSAANDATAILLNGSYVFSTLKLINGFRVNNYFTVSSTTNVRSLFTIPNKNIDTSTLKVYVRDSINSIGRTEYTLAENVYEITSTSNVYFLQESYDGYFQIYFGNNVIGKQPINNNIVDVDYFVVENYSDADGCRTFTLDGNIEGATSINLNTTQVSFGGSDKESIDSIKHYAVKSNSAKERTVTANDYTLTLKEQFNFIKSAAVWGGEDNVPPMYGKVFISVQPVSGYTISDEVKNNLIIPVLKKTSVMTIRPELVDPSYIVVEFNSKIKLNQYKTTNTKSVVETAVKTTIKDYVSSVSTFNSAYLESALVNLILDSDPGVVSVNISKKLGFNLAPIINVNTFHSHNIGNAVELNSVSSNRFKTYNNTSVIVSIKEIHNSSYVSNGSTISRLGLYDTSDNLVSDIGFVDLTLGKFELTFGVYEYLYDVTYIAVRFKLVDADITMTQNKILILDSTIRTTPINDNIVITEMYDK